MGSAGCRPVRAGCTPTEWPLGDPRNEFMSLNPTDWLLRAKRTTYVQLQHRPEALGVRRDDKRCKHDDQRGRNRLFVLFTAGRVGRILVGVVLYDLLGVESFDLRSDDFTRHKALDGERQQDGHREQHPAEVHQVIVPAVVLQQVSCGN